MGCKGVSLAISMSDFILFWFFILFLGGFPPMTLMLCYFSLFRQRKVTKRKAPPARRAVLSGRQVVAGFGARLARTLRTAPRYGITAGLRPSERASGAAVGASGGFISAGALRCRTGGRLRRGGAIASLLHGAKVVIILRYRNVFRRTGYNCTLSGSRFVFNFPCRPQKEPANCTIFQFLRTKTAARRSLRLLRT